MSPTTPMDIPFHAILDTLPSAVVALDAQGVIAYANKRAEKVLGATLYELHGNDFTEYVAVPLSDGLKFDDYTLQTAPIMLGGESTGTLILFHEDDGAQAIEETTEYRQLAEHMEAVFHSSSDGIWVTDGDGVVLDINSASENLNSINAADMIGRNVADLEEDGLVDKSATLEVLRKKRRVSVLQEVQKTGRQLIVTGTPTFDEEGNIKLVILNERDITDLNDLRSTLAQTRKAKEKAEAELTGLSLMELTKGYVVAESRAMQTALATARKLAQLETSEILLMGDSGTGKGLLAKFIHDSSPRREKPFIQINCATLPETLFEAELFGYEKGAFTGASEKGKSGLFELASGGTFFLDEVGEIPLDMQAKLLKCLDDHEYYPLGGSRPKRVNCVIVAATNRELEALVHRKQFRRDLLYRLNTFTVNIPPLRERPEDIFELVHHYLHQFNAAFRSNKRIGPDGMNLLQQYSFPGNVRELIGIIKKAVVICEEEFLDEYLEDLFDPSARAGGDNPTMTEEVARLERKLLRQAMAACTNTREMARYLGISQPTVVRKMQRYSLKDTDS